MRFNCGRGRQEVVDLDFFLALYLCCEMIARVGVPVGAGKGRGLTEGCRIEWYNLEVGFKRTFPKCEWKGREGGGGRRGE